MAEVDILGPSDRRRIRSAEEKAALLAEVDAEGGKVRLVARRRGVSESLLYNWRSARKAAAVAAGAPEDVQFVPIGVLGARRRADPRWWRPPNQPLLRNLRQRKEGGSIEITLPNGARVSVDAFVNEKALSRVLRAMKGVA